MPSCTDALLDAAIEKHRWSHRVAIQSESNLARSYCELRDVSNWIANILVHDASLVAGNRVLSHWSNLPMLIVAWFGVFKARAMACHDDATNSFRKVTIKVRLARISHTLCEDALSTELEVALKCMPEGNHMRFDETDGAHLYDRLLSKYWGMFETIETREDDPYVISFTSGTSGEPKAAVHFHRNVIAICHCFPRHVPKPTADDVFCGSPPLALTFGFCVLLLFPISVGLSVIPPPRASPERALIAVARYRVSILLTAPVAYWIMLGRPDDHDVSSLRKCVPAGMCCRCRRAIRGISEPISC
ncbi:hypothetical protein WJ74_16365 [Burkholderia ubonensis]|uniref:AMP-binding protein n=1 Tax=Burkholderia ubonensis TaxID=101571 RepID=UPI00075E5E2C|nr:AMP-binding protein [Burkholderia ubonensis]KVO11050.1 hypothetical protein WJ74_16365 [Burkholderia ubonensis]